MGGGHGRAHPGRQVQPQGSGQQRRRHQPDKGAAVVKNGRINDVALNGGDHIPPGDQGAAGFEHRRDQNRGSQRQGSGAHRRADVVGNVVGANVDGHIAANDSRSDKQ